MDCMVICFCKKCKISFCFECIKNNYHPNHDIKYTNDIKDMDKILNIYKTNLNNAFTKMSGLIKMKYGSDFELKITNIFEPQKLPFNLDIEDKEIIFCLELLKTFYDIYIYKEKHNILNYQAIAHIIKHREFAIIRLKDKKRKIADPSRIISIGSDNSKDINSAKKSSHNLFNIVKNIFIQEPKNEITNNNIDIILKIDLKDREKRDNEIHMEFLETHTIFLDKIKKLKNNGLALSFYGSLVLHKDQTVIKIL